MAADAAYTAVVTGASGFVATELVAQLLAKAYNVRATVRSARSSDKVDHLKALGTVFPGTITIHEADLLTEGSFDEVIKGADYVFHTASPYKTGVEDPENELIKPAAQGTKNVLSSAVKSKDTVKRVIVTSSFAAVVKAKKGPSNGKVFTPDDWNDEARATKEEGYYLSKVAGERAAIEIGEQHGIEVISILPTAVFGPVISKRSDATSVQIIKGIIENTSFNTLLWQCNLADIAKAHILAAETPSAKGRYLVCTPHEVTQKMVSDVLVKRFPQYKFQTDNLDNPSPKPFADVSKTEQELGLSITPWQTSIIDMAVSVIKLGIATPVPQ